MDKKIASHICRMLTGDISAAEKKELDDWLALSNDNLEEYQAIRLLWKRSQDAIESNDEMFALIHARIGKLAKISQRRKIFMLFLLAAGILAGLYIVFWFMAADQPW